MARECNSNATMIDIIDIDIHKTTISFDRAPMSFAHARCISCSDLSTFRFLITVKKRRTGKGGEALKPRRNLSSSAD